MICGMRSIFSICVLAACRQWLHVFTEIRFADAQEVMPSLIAKNIQSAKRAGNTYPDTSLHGGASYKTYESSSIESSVPSNWHCFRALLSKASWPLSQVLSTCKQSLENNKYGNAEATKQTWTTTNGGSLLIKQKKHVVPTWQMYYAPETKQSEMVADNFFAESKGHRSPITNASLAKTAALPGTHKHPENETSINLSTRKRNSGCNLGVPITIDENQPLPWECYQRRQWRSLNGSVYPDRLYETVCEGSCMNGHYNCTPVRYTTHVVQFCLGGVCGDERTPFVYRNVWRFLDIEVTVGCLCTR